MGMNMSEKILASHSGRDHVEPGELVICDLDLVMANDVTGPPAIKIFESMGKEVFDREKIALVPDHYQECRTRKNHA